MTQSEAQALKQAMREELQARPGAAYRCAAGIVAIVLLSMIGPVVGLSAEAVQTFASAGMLDHLGGIAN